MARRPSKSPPKFADRGVPATTRPAMPWAVTPGLYIAGKEALDAADQLGVEMDRKWGVGRLRLLVNGPMREKFDRQRYLMAQARWEGTLEDVKRESARMVTAYTALDNAAKGSGATPVDDSIWEVVPEIALRLAHLAAPGDVVAGGAEGVVGAAEQAHIAYQPTAARVRKFAVGRGLQQPFHALRQAVVVVGDIEERGGGVRVVIGAGQIGRAHV